MVASNGQLFKEKTQKIPPKPTVLEVIPENIPEELKAIPNWVCWCYELRQKQPGGMEVDEAASPGQQPLCSVGSAPDLDHV